MKKYFYSLLIVLLLFSNVFAVGTYTDPHQLYRPAFGEKGSDWWPKINLNYTNINRLLAHYNTSDYTTLNEAVTAIGSVVVLVNVCVVMAPDPEEAAAVVIPVTAARVQA